MQIPNQLNSNLFRFTNILMVLAFFVVTVITPSIASASGNGPAFDSVDFFRYNGEIYVHGYVDDPDDDVEGFAVEIDGDIHGTAYVDENGYFSIQIPEPWTPGSVFVYISVEDPAGNSDQDGKWL